MVILAFSTTPLFFISFLQFSTLGVVIVIVAVIFIILLPSGGVLHDKHSVTASVHHRLVMHPGHSILSAFLVSWATSNSILVFVSLPSSLAVFLVSLTSRLVECYSFLEVGSDAISPVASWSQSLQSESLLPNTRFLLGPGFSLISFCSDPHITFFVPPCLC